MDFVTYLDSDNVQKIRPCTDEEQAEIDYRRTLGLGFEQRNAVILEQLAEIDRKSIRALREGDNARIADLESEAATLRSKLVK